MPIEENSRTGFKLLPTALLVHWTGWDTDVSKMFFMSHIIILQCVSKLMTIVTVYCALLNCSCFSTDWSL